MQRALLAEGSSCRGLFLQRAFLAEGLSCRGHFSQSSRRSRGAKGDLVGQILFAVALARSAPEGRPRSSSRPPTGPGRPSAPPGPGDCGPVQHLPVQGGHDLRGLQLTGHPVYRCARGEDEEGRRSGGARPDVPGSISALALTTEAQGPRRGHGGDGDGHPSLKDEWDPARHARRPRVRAAPRTRTGRPLRGHRGSRQRPGKDIP